MKQESRPMECAFCNVKTGYHAMHPLFDMPGPEGRQLVLPASGAGFKRVEKRLAWVHSLCAQFICSATYTKGCVYALFDGGRYEGYGQFYPIGTEVSNQFDEGVFSGKVIDFDKDEQLYKVRYEDGDEAEYDECELEDILVSRKKPRHSNGSKSSCGDEDTSENDLYYATEAFCISTDDLLEEGLKDSGLSYEKNLKDARELKCMICNSNDKHSLRIPVQCKAYDKEEFKEFKKCHKKQKGAICTTAMHVGCARWATSNYAAVKGKRLRMCYFYPGQKAGYEGEDFLYKNTVCDAFCRVHAREVMEHMRDAVKSTHDEESEEEPESPQAKAAKIIAEKKKKNRFLEDSDEDD